MATASRNERKKRRVRRNLTLATRAYRQEAMSRMKVQTILLTILAANGGEVYITQDGVNSAVQSLGQAQYVVEKAKYDKDGLPAPEGLFVVRLVTGEETATATAQAFPSAAELLGRDPSEPPAPPAPIVEGETVEEPPTPDDLDNLEGVETVFEGDNITTPVAEV